MRIQRNCVTEPIKAALNMTQEKINRKKPKEKKKKKKKEEFGVNTWLERRGISKG
jgi:hypothetical protein